MKLFYRKYGAGQPMIILHGLFGQSDNWNSLAKHFAEQGLEVYTVDQRNHGLSPHSDEWTYKSMSDDIHELVNDLGLNNIILLGHSMGGKTAMQYAIDEPSKVDKLIVADMSPRYYPLHHEAVIKGLNAVDLTTTKTRKEAEASLEKYITDYGTKQFLLKNIYWKEDGTLDWRFNLKVITEKIVNAGEAIPTDSICEVPSLFIKGEKSDYIRDDDTQLIRHLFPNSDFETIADAGHWVHAEKPKEFFECVMQFVNSAKSK
jgi:esterase